MSLANFAWYDSLREGFESIARTTVVAFFQKPLYPRDSANLMCTLRDEVEVKARATNKSRSVLMADMVN